MKGTIDIGVPVITIDLSVSGIPMLVGVFLCIGCGGWHIEVAERLIDGIKPIDVRVEGENEAFDDPSAAVNAAMQIVEDHIGRELPIDTAIEAEYRIIPFPHEVDIDEAIRSFMGSGEVKH